MSLRRHLGFLLFASACQSQPGQRAVQADGASDSAADSIISLTRPGVPRYDIEQLVRLRTTMPLDVSPDSRWVLYGSDSTGISQIWKAPLAGGKAVPVTAEPEPVREAMWAPDGAHLAFNQDYGGNERYDVFLADSAGGTPRNLTHSPTVREQAVGFSEDGRSLAFVSDVGRPGHFELWVYDLGAGAPRKLTNDSVSTFNALWSHDGRSLALLRTNDFSDARVLLYDVAAGRERLLTPRGAHASYIPAGFSPDDRQLLTVSDAKDSVPHLAVVDLASDSLRWIATGPWEVVAATWTRRDAIAYAENADGRVTTYLIRPDGSGRRRVGPERGATYLAKASLDGRYLLLNHSDATRPHDVWVYDTERDSSWQVTSSFTGGVSSEALAPAALVHYPTFDGRKISAFVTLPFNLQRDGTHPAIVMPHGGPSGQYQDDFDAEAAFLANHGYVVIRPNVRGSTGYGKAFEDLNNRDWGGGDLKDLLAAVDYLTGTGYVARDKIALLGASYGGYLTLAALAFTPDRWAAGVDFFGVSSVLTLFRTTDPLLRPYLEREMGSIEKDEALMRERSPITRADSIRAPLLILQGDNDPRVPLSESRQIAQAMRRRGAVAELVVYPNEGHGFSRLEHRLDSARRAVAFLDRYLLGASRPAATQ